MAEYLAAFDFLGNPVYWLVLLVAVFIVGPLGLIPGVGGFTIMAISLPILIFNVTDPVVGLTFLAALAGLGNTLDSVPAVLLGYPGAATQVTFLEGHQLAMRGRGAHTLGAIYVVSAIGGVVGAVVLLVTMPFLRPIMIRFSFPEIAAMALFGVLMVSVLSRGAVLKGLVAGCLGILMGTVGTSFIAGEPRFTFDSLYLFDGLPLIPTLIGIFALPELVDLTMRARPVSVPGSVSTREVLQGGMYGLRHWKVAVRQSLFGVFLGAVPGIGSAVVDWLAYAFGMAFHKDKSTFGKGNLDGVLFAESAQNSKEGGQIIPTLAFGVPGGTSWAIVLVAMFAYGVAPGPGMLDVDKNLDVTMAMATTLALGNLFITLLGLVATGQLAKVTLLPYSLLAAVLLPLVFVAAYQATNHWGDLGVVCAVGALGIAMKWLGWPRPPFILGFILGPIIEKNLWPAVQVYGFGMITRPITVTLVVLGVAVVVYLTWAMGKGSASTAAATTSSEGAEASISGASEGVSDTLGQPPAPEVSKAQGRGLIWRWEFILPLILLMAPVTALWQSQGFLIPASRFLPMWVSILMIPLIVLQLIQASLSRSEQGAIMDLGMRTGTDRAALKRLANVSAWIGGYMLAIAIIGMPLASVGFAVAFAAVNLKWRGWSRLWALAPAVLISLVIYGFFGTVMYVDWPAGVVTTLLFP